ncbi:Calcyphosin-2 [Geodia barretti]|uniref:Calcyphosin-2 n=1 Tax=Geodia barretti TaxID=519541 RepID=A0AA35XAJ9_GEOBA|nr:Calcyphosin-2 [Geodia barretti]
MAQQLKIPWQYAGYGGPQQRVYQPPSLPLGAGRRGGGEGKPGAPPKLSPRSPGAALATSGKRLRPPATATDSRSKEESSQRKTGSQGLSSTPHAPRKKRSVLELLPGGVGGSLLLPSTHQLLQKHSYIDSGKLKTVPLKESNVERKREGEKGGGRGKERKEQRKEIQKPVLTKKQAWKEGHKKTGDKQVKQVQPYRRTVTTTLPEGVPLLDLSRLNEPDHQMKPVDLIDIEDSDSTDGADTNRSFMSWGVPCSQSLELTNEEKEGKEGEERGREEDEKDVSFEEQVMEIEDETSEVGERLMDATQAKFVEDKILSHERAISSLSPHPPPPLPTQQQDHAPQKVGGALQSNVTFGLGMSETGLVQRLQFEARVLTHNGRDMHRELCGFFFLSDGSITVYEFRRFGKKSSALPLVQRKVYCHQVGHRRGEPYQINFIRKGFTLHFPTSLLPSLPDYMASRPLLSLRITRCSEREKRQLMCAHRKPLECVSIDTFLKNPLSPPEQQAWAQLRRLQAAVREQLVGRARKALVGLGRHISKQCSLSVGKELMKTAVHMFHIYISSQWFHRICDCSL